MDWIIWLRIRTSERLLNMVMKLRVKYNVGKFLSSCITGSFSRMAHLHGVSKLIKLSLSKLLHL
jgi:hypothetical protein